MTDCEKQDELEENHTSMQRQKTMEEELYHKEGAVMYTVLYGQIHPDIITIAKQSTTPNFKTIQQKQKHDVVSLVKNPPNNLCSEPNKF